MSWLSTLSKVTTMFDIDASGAEVGGILGSVAPGIGNVAGALGGASLASAAFAIGVAQADK